MQPIQVCLIHWIQEELKTRSTPELERILYQLQRKSKPTLKPKGSQITYDD